MKTKVLAIVLTFAFSGPAAFAAAKADFGGTWALDKARSEGLPPDMDQTLTVKQAADRVDVEAKISGGRGEQTVTDSYFLDGKARDFTPALVGGGTGKGRRTSAWTAEGDGFDATEEATIEGPEGAETVKATRRWRVSPDGKTLTIEMTFEGANGAVKSKRVFTRK
ncbi:MAG TPA: hypothetical protein VF570_21385 [Pyrinomonadaceae bacterium]|jgi:hypothetical protein